MSRTQLCLDIYGESLLEYLTVRDAVSEVLKAIENGDKEAIAAAMKQTVNGKMNFEARLNFLLAELQKQVDAAMILEPPQTAKG